MRLDGIYRYAREQGWSVQVVEKACSGIDLAGTLDFYRPCGVIAEAYCDELERLESEVGARRLPIVLFDADWRNGDAKYCVAKTDLGESAANYLLSLGLKHYAFAAYTFHKVRSWSDLRRDSFKSKVVKAGKSCHVFDPGRVMDRVEYGRRLSEWLENLPRPCGILAANDIVGEEVVGAALRLGISIPEEMSVLGVDNDVLICENLPVTLSSVAADYERGGYLAAQLLGELMSKPRMKRTTRFYPADRIVVRQSTRRFALDRGRIGEAVEFIRTHACKGISVGDVVKVMRIPRRTAELNFRSATGRSILEEIDEVRFAKVFELLSNPRQDIKSICDFAGFANDRTLRKAFSLRVGMSMREWRLRKSSAIYDNE